MRIGLIVLIAFILSSMSLPQDQEERQLWDAEFLKKRAPAKSTTAPPRKTSYRKVTPRDPSVDAKATGEMVGITIWKLRKPKAADSEDSRLLIAEGNESGEWTPERVEADTVFTSGDRVRLSIESPRNGYLYVINREQYSDGTMSDPYLIFPTQRNRGGDNSVKAGKVIELPGRAAFRLEPQNANYVGEVLTLFITSQPLAEITPGAGMIKLDKQLISQMEARWHAPVERYEMTDGAGKTYTKGEKEAGVEGKRLLTQEDELPQTLFRILSKPGNPLVLSVSLKVNKQ